MIQSVHSSGNASLNQDDNSKEVLICHENKGGGLESTIIIGPSKCVVV